LNRQGFFEHIIKELSGANAEVRACKKEYEAVMIDCLLGIATQIARQNRMIGDGLDFIASHMREGGDRDFVRELANAYHMPSFTASEPC
jgi:hypothetical protein